MPLDPSKYPKGWKRISYQVRFVLSNGTCSFCGAKHGEINQKTGKAIVIMAAHKSHSIESEVADPEAELIPLCGACHNRFDLPYRQSKRIRNKLKKINALTFPFYDL